MDKVRLGRALGYGTRHAAKTLAAVAEAAAAPNPREAESPHQRTGPGDPSRAAQMPAAPRRPPATARRLPKRSTVREASRHFWAPLVTFSSALWLRVTGFFFGVIALAMLSGAWKLHDAATGAQAGTEGAHHFWLFVTLFALFSYFAVSSFVRATSRERRQRG